MDIKSLISANSNERFLTLANFVREVGMQAAYWIGIFAYAAYGFDGDATTVMIVMLVVNIANMLGSLIGGGVVDKIGPRRTILLTTVLVVAICMVPIVIGGNIFAFVIFAGVFSIFTTILNAGYMAFAPYLEKGKAGLRRINSYLTIGTFIAAVAGPALGAIATSHFPVYSVFILMAIVTAAGGLVIVRVHERYSPEEDEGESEEAEVEAEGVAGVVGNFGEFGAAAKVAGAQAYDTAAGVAQGAHTPDFDPIEEAEQLAREHGIELLDPVRITETSVAAGGAVAGRNVPKRRVKKSSPFGEAIEGWRLITNSRNLRYYLMVTIAMIFGFGAFDALEPLYFHQILQVEIHMLGWINAIGGLGLIVGVVLLAVFPIKWVNARLLVALLLICGAGAIAYVATTNLWWVGAGQLILGFAFGIFDPLLRTMVQADSPLKAVGRVLGTINMITIGLLLIPLVAAPWLSDLLGVQEVLILAGALPIVLGFLLYPSGRRLDKELGDKRQIEGVDIIE